jgi:hypothetical protein
VRFKLGELLFIRMPDRSGFAFSAAAVGVINESGKS